MHWNGLQRDVVESASMEVFRNRGDVTPGDVVGGHGGGGLRLDLGRLSEVSSCSP